MNNPFKDPNLPKGMPFNPNFNPQNINLCNLNGPNPNNFNPPNPNLQAMAQNNPLGVIQMLAAQIQSNPQLQMNLLNQLQAQNLAAPFQPFMGHNPNQMMGMQNPQFFPENQMMSFPGYGNPGLLKSERPMSCTPVKAQWNKEIRPQASGSQQFQGNYVEVSRCATSQCSANRGPVRTFRGSGKGQSHNRFQKSQLPDMRSSRGNMNKFNRRGGRGQSNWRERRSKPMGFCEAAPTVSMRSLPVNYTKHEIQQWREARKKNFPTRANMNKKTTKICNNEDADAKLRRQQLKEVLAKQAELGVEIAEIPPDYLSESETRIPNRKHEREGTYGRSGDRFNKWRDRGNGRDNSRSKRQKIQNKGALASPLPVKREPSLLEKLLSSDIKREKIRLLQVFRFLVLNDFFKQWPDKPLEFPIVNVKDGGVFKDIGGQKESSLAEEMEDYDEHETLGHDEVPNDTIEEQFQESEEGEIT